MKCGVLGRIRKSRWLRFNIRALFMFVTLVGVFLGWFGVRIKKGHDQHQAVLAIQKAHSIVLYDYQFDKSGRFITGIAPGPPGPEWLRRLIGDHTFTRIQRVQLGASFSTADSIHLKFLHTLEELDLSDRDITDVAVENLKGLKKLRTLNLDNTLTTNAGLRYVGRIGTLQELSLRGTKIGDAGLAELSGLRKLIKLDVSSTDISDAGIDHLRSLVNLQTLLFARTRVTDAGLSKLKDLTHLTTLDLSRTQITHDGLAHLANHKRLESLGIHGCDIRFGHVVHLFTNLQGRTFSDALIALGHRRDRQGQLSQIGLPKMEVRDEDLVHLASLHSIRELWLNDNPITDAGLEHLLHLKQLQSLDLARTQVSDAGFVHLSRLTQLKFLSLADTTVTETGIETLRHELPHCEIFADTLAQPHWPIRW